MIRAILKGSKTQTRRIVKPQPSPAWFPHGGLIDIQKKPITESSPVIGRGFCNYGGDEGYACPYGVPGDNLWCRETWAEVWMQDQHKFPGTIVYRADDNATDEMLDENEAVVPMKWRPSIFMPRAASRITLEITGIRVERLDDISEKDAIAEGVRQSPISKGYWWDYSTNDIQAVCMTARQSYRTLWESINGAGSWQSNPFVWVIEFRRIETEEKNNAA
jgi:hypothetical protein